MSVSVSAPIKSPSLGEISDAILVDENSYHIPALAIVQPSANGLSGLSAQVIVDGQVSQVTARRDAPQVTLPSSRGKAKVIALFSMDSSGNLVPFQAGSAASVSGKFQSAVRVATGASENIAHGLGVVPSLVLLSIYDSNGVSLPIAMSEGAHDSTNLKVTVTASVKYKVIAFA